jgi:ubiquinone/menaquinone biosynthesis C-methylase UbiE
MSKTGEKEYLKNRGEECQKHAFNKPFSDEQCDHYLIDMGLILSLLPSPPGKLLDLGVGTGWTSVMFAQRGYDVTGQDIAEDMISLAEQNKKRYNLDNCKFIVCDYEDMPFSNEFDYAVFYDSLHHSVNISDALKAVYRSLIQGGMCITVEPGTGHSKSDAAIKAMDEWDVTEKDMPPSLIIQEGKKVGFRKVKVYLRINNSPIEILQYLSLCGFKNVCRTLLRFLPWSGMKRPNITVLKK